MTELAGGGTVLSRLRRVAAYPAGEGDPYTIRFTETTDMDCFEDVGTVFARAATETPEEGHGLKPARPACGSDILAAIHAVPRREVKAEGPSLCSPRSLMRKHSTRYSRARSHPAHRRHEVDDGF